MFLLPFAFFIIFAFMAGGLFRVRAASLRIALGLCVIYVHIFLFNLFSLNIDILLYILIFEFFVLSIYLSEDLKAFKSADRIFCLIITAFFSVLLFRHCYLNFSDSMYHFSSLRRMVHMNEFFNHSPFFGPEFSDIRYSYSFYVPFQAVNVMMLRMLPGSVEMPSAAIYSYMHIFLYIISSIAVYDVQKKYFGRFTALITVFFFSVFFSFVRAMDFSGYAFSLSAYPSAFSVYFIFPVLLFIIKEKKISSAVIFLIGLVAAGTHVFYWTAFLLISAFSFLYYRDIRKTVFFCLGGLPVVFIKIAGYEGVSNSFFGTAPDFSPFYNMFRWGNGITLPLSLFALPILGFALLRRREPFMTTGLIIVSVTGFLAPFIAQHIIINPHKFQRIYQFSPALFLIGVPLTFLLRKYRKIFLFIVISIFITGCASLFLRAEKNTIYSFDPDIISVFQNFPQNKKVLADPETSMLMSCFSYSWAVSIYPEYASPVVPDIIDRQTAWEDYLRTFDNRFNADYVIVPKGIKLSAPDSLVTDTGGKFWLLKIK
ncbi:MAG: hypothetical protein ACOCWO_00555 [Candidatus Muiribacteriaceae bacterium]